MDMDKYKSIFEKYDISTSYFTLDGVNTYGRLVDIHDGDTCKIILPVMDQYYKFNVRLNGIDTCEINSDNPENKNKSLQARDKICQMIQEMQEMQGKGSEKIIFKSQKEIKEYLRSIVCIVFVKCYGFDKYGRLLADVFIDNKSISEILINEKLAYAYDGGKKLSETQQLEIFK